MVSVVVMAVVSVVALAVGVVIGSSFGLGRQDDIMHALAMLLERPTDPNMRENARKVLRG